VGRFLLSSTCFEWGEGEGHTVRIKRKKEEGHTVRKEEN
jgi:hypothetical protein